ncbi:hypothetical protein [Qipengyuania spongiae]|uniref:Isochorismatase family protein n=1 Tax=Qipengyuania spongiae TaxID=2909673 RepID=A0ABY5SYZ0_9SPHN|nr:hypothetical protein [Qipengyuania spongiae]UVI39479.1 hypothetical protein L1F33_00500 [Qipengyuania spongiae]
MSHAELAPTLDPDDAVIVFADLQPTLVRKSRTQSGEAIAAGPHALARAAQIFDWPLLVSMVAVDGQPAGHLPALEGFTNEANSFTRSHARSFGDEPCHGVRGPR